MGIKLVMYGVFGPLGILFGYNASVLSSHYNTPLDSTKNRVVAILRIWANSDEMAYFSMKPAYGLIIYMRKRQELDSCKHGKVGYKVAGAEIYAEKSHTLAKTLP